MKFTYDAYRELIRLLKQNQYRVCGYHDNTRKDKCVILRHDIDYSVEHAVRLARVEQEEGVQSTYFVLLKTDFYNPASKRVNDMLHEIKNMGHEIGLHFDEVAYPGCDPEEVPALIQHEAKVLGDICGFPIRSFSMHRPSQKTIEKNLCIEGLVNSYGQEFFREFKYLSDSRRNWREPVVEIVRNNEYERLHILTHAFWYEEAEGSISSSVRDFIISAKEERYQHFFENIRDLESIISVDEIAE